MKKIISLLVVAVLLCTAFVACNNNGSDSSVATVKVTIEAEGAKILENIEVSVKGVDGEAPLAFDAILAALDDNDIEYETVEFAGTEKLEKIGDYDTQDNAYIWELYLNGDDEPASGRLATVEIADGDKLLVKRNAYESIKTEEETTVATKAPVIEDADDGYEE